MVIGQGRTRRGQGAVRRPLSRYRRRAAGLHHRPRRRGPPNTRRGPQGGRPQGRLPVPASAFQRLGDVASQTSAAASFSETASPQSSAGVATSGWPTLTDGRPTSRRSPHASPLDSRRVLSPARSSERQSRRRDPGGDGGYWRPRDWRPRDWHPCPEGRTERSGLTRRRCDLRPDHDLPPRRRTLALDRRVCPLDWGIRLVDPGADRGRDPPGYGYPNWPPKSLQGPRVRLGAVRRPLHGPRDRPPIRRLKGAVADPGVPGRLDMPTRGWRGSRA